MPLLPSSMQCPKVDGAKPNRGWELSPWAQAGSCLSLSPAPYHRGETEAQRGAGGSLSLHMPVLLSLPPPLHRHRALHAASPGCRSSPRSPAAMCLSAESRAGPGPCPGAVCCRRSVCPSICTVPGTQGSGPLGTPSPRPHLGGAGGLSCWPGRGPRAVCSTDPGPRGLELSCPTLHLYSQSPPPVPRPMHSADPLLPPCPTCHGDSL